MKLSFFKRLRFWLMTKRETINFIQQIMEINEAEISMVVKILEGMEQNKMYIVYVKDATPEDLQAILKGFKVAANRLSWTPPEVLFTNKEVTITEKS